MFPFDDESPRKIDVTAMNFRWRSVASALVGNITKGRPLFRDSSRNTGRQYAFFPSFNDVIRLLPPSPPPRCPPSRGTSLGHNGCPSIGDISPRRISDWLTSRNKFHAGIIILLLDPVRLFPPRRQSERFTTRKHIISPCVIIVLTLVSRAIVGKSICFPRLSPGNVTLSNDSLSLALWNRPRRVKSLTAGTCRFYGNYNTSQPSRDFARPRL